jgi:hypothetical protein
MARLLPSLAPRRRPRRVEAVHRSQHTAEGTRPGLATNGQAALHDGEGYFRGVGTHADFRGKTGKAHPMVDKKPREGHSRVAHDTDPNTPGTPRCLPREKAIRGSSGAVIYMLSISTS